MFFLHLPSHTVFVCGGPMTTSIAWERVLNLRKCWLDPTNGRLSPTGGFRIGRGELDRGKNFLRSSIQGPFTDIWKLEDQNGMCGKGSLLDTVKTFLMGFLEKNWLCSILHLFDGSKLDQLKLSKSLECRSAS